MNSKGVPFVALVLGAVWFGCYAETNQWHGFEILPPITNANPAIRHEVSFRVPTKLNVERTTNSLSIAVDANSLESTNLMVGTNMVTGVLSELYVYPAEEKRSEKWRSQGLGGTDFNLGTSILNAKQDGIPLPGENYVVEMDLAIFETDIPPQHMWSPQGRKNYKVLWKRKLKQDADSTLPDANDDGGSKKYFESQLADCQTNEIRCIWFLGDNPRVGMVMKINLDAETVFTVRDVYNWALQGSHTRELSHAQVLSLKEIIGSLPPSDKNAEFNKSVFVSIRKDANAETFQYDRRHAPAPIQRLYDISGGYFENGAAKSR